MTTVKFDATQGVGYVLDGEGDFDESAHPRDEKGQFAASGNTVSTPVSVHEALEVGKDYAHAMPNTPPGASVVYRGGHNWEMTWQGETRARPNNERMTQAVLKGLGK